MHGLCISLLGKFNVRCRGQILSGFHGHKVQELFSYLLLYRDQPLSRETLATALWADDSTTQTRKNLRQALWQLQAGLDGQVEPGNPRVLLAEPEWLWINPQADLWVDVTAFERAFELAQGVPVGELSAQRVQGLRDAAKLYRGDLLEYCYQGWCQYERERLQNIHLVMLSKLMEYCEAHHDYDGGLACGTRILRCDRANERTHRGLMRLHYLAGDRTTALRQYEHCVAILAEELGARPERATVALYEQILGEQTGGPTLASPQSCETSEATSTLLPGALRHLKHLRSSLIELQRQVEVAIRTVERDLASRR